MTENVYIPTQDNQKLYGALSTPQAFNEVTSLNNLLIIMVHGFPGDHECHDNIYTELAFFLSDKGFQSLALDYTGCGKSDGQREDFTLSRAREDLKHTISWARNKGYERFIFIGEGLGAVLPLTDHNDIASCFVLLWPILDLPQAAREVFNFEGENTQWKQAGYFVHGNERINYTLMDELSHGDISGALTKVDKPIIVMHGAQDQTAPIDKLDLLREHTHSRRIEITSFQDGGHGLPKANHRKAMYYHIMQFIEKYS